MGFVPQGYTPVYEDSNACIEWSNNIIGGRERAEHVNIRKHCAHGAIQNGHPRLVRVDSSEQLADVFTESLQPRVPLLHAACMARILPGWVVVGLKGGRVSRGDTFLLSENKSSYYSTPYSDDSVTIRRDVRIRI